MLDLGIVWCLGLGLVFEAAGDGEEGLLMETIEADCFRYYFI